MPLPPEPGGWRRIAGGAANRLTESQIKAVLLKLLTEVSGRHRLVDRLAQRRLSGPVRRRIVYGILYQMESDG
jgi:hypothetical protein